VSKQFSRWADIDFIVVPGWFVGLVRELFAELAREQAQELGWESVLGLLEELVREKGQEQALESSGLGLALGGQGQE
jgi:hypothetical protein